MSRRSVERQLLLMQALERRDRFVSAQTLHRELVAEGMSISLSTIYRGLRQLDGTAIERRVTTDGEAVYRLRDLPGDQVIVCRRCGTTAAVDARAPRRWAAERAIEHGFTAIDPRLQLSGLCAACSRHAR